MYCENRLKGPGEFFKSACQFTNKESLARNDRFILLCTLSRLLMILMSKAFRSKGVIMNFFSLKRKAVSPGHHLSVPPANSLVTPSSGAFIVTDSFIFNLPGINK